MKAWAGLLKTYWRKKSFTIGKPLSPNESPDMTPERAMKILLTGGTGFIGQAALRELLQRGHRVVATTRRFHNDLSCDRNLEWVSWDGTKEALPHVPWPEFQAILHLAAVTDAKPLSENAKEIYELSAGTTFRFLEAARSN